MKRFEQIPEPVMRWLIVSAFLVNVGLALTIALLVAKLVAR